MCARSEKSNENQFLDIWNRLQLELMQSHHENDVTLEKDEGRELTIGIFNTRANRSPFEAGARHKE